MQACAHREYIPCEQQGVGLPRQAESTTHEGEEHAAISGGGQNVGLQTLHSPCVRSVHRADGCSIRTVCTSKVQPMNFEILSTIAAPPVMVSPSTVIMEDSRCKEKHIRSCIVSGGQ